MGSLESTAGAGVEKCGLEGGNCTCKGMECLELGKVRGDDRRDKEMARAEARAHTALHARHRAPALCQGSEAP